MGEISLIRKVGQELEGQSTRVESGHWAFQTTQGIGPVYLGPMHGLIPLIVLALYGGYSGHGIALEKEIIS